MFAAHNATAQSFGGLKIGSNAAAVAGLGAAVALGENGPDRYAKFRMASGHDLSVTTRNFGPIIYMENSRNHSVLPTPGQGFRFGITTRRDLVDVIGNDGYTYENRDRVLLGSDVVIFHSYELLNEPGVVVTFAFLLKPDRVSLGDDAAVLDSIAIAQAWYLDEIWSTTKTGKPGYMPITLQY
ncbi:MAG: hypothetical protein R8G34_02120 [Paracoccaceae bacterium]|nr:hypothetical protein [Paracoccaceae bacterium]